MIVTRMRASFPSVRRRAAALAGVTALAALATISLCACLRRASIPREWPPGLYIVDQWGVYTPVRGRGTVNSTSCSILDRNALSHGYFIEPTPLARFHFDPERFEVTPLAPSPEVLSLFYSSGRTRLAAVVQERGRRAVLLIDPGSGASHEIQYPRNFRPYQVSLSPDGHWVLLAAPSKFALGDLEGGGCEIVADGTEPVRGIGGRFVNNRLWETVTYDGSSIEFRGVPRPRLMASLPNVGGGSITPSHGGDRFFAVRDPGTGAGRIFLAPSQSGVLRDTGISAEFPIGVCMRPPCWSPDDRYLAFVGDSLRGLWLKPVAHVYILDATSGRKVQIYQGPPMGGYQGVIWENP
jgi:hypothetical protein